MSLCASCNSARGLQHSHLEPIHFGKIRLDFDTGKFLTADRHFTKPNNRIQAGYLFSVKSVAMLLLYLVIIPVGLKYLTGKRSFSTAAANLTGTKISIVILCIGALAISLSVEIWMFIPGKLPFTLIESRLNANTKLLWYIYLEMD